MDLGVRWPNFTHWGHFGGVFCLDMFNIGNASLLLVREAPGVIQMRSQSLSGSKQESLGQIFWFTIFRLPNCIITYWPKNLCLNLTVTNMHFSWLRVMVISLQAPLICQEFNSTCNLNWSSNPTFLRWSLPESRSVPSQDKCLWFDRRKHQPPICWWDVLYDYPWHIPSPWVGLL